MSYGHRFPRGLQPRAAAGQGGGQRGGGGRWRRPRPRSWSATSCSEASRSLSSTEVVFTSVVPEAASATVMLEQQQQPWRSATGGYVSMGEVLPVLKLGMDACYRHRLVGAQGNANKRKRGGKVTIFQMQGDPIHLYTPLNTIPTPPGSVGMLNQTSGVAPWEPGLSWPQPGQPAVTARDRKSNTPLL
jgi:hypothetical protein